MEEVLQNLTPETIKATLVLFFGVLAITPVFVAILFKSLGGLKWGLGLGFILAHAAIFIWSPLAIGVIVVEGGIAIAIGVVWLFSVTYRKVDIVGEGSSLERGPAWWFRPEPPVVKGIEARYRGQQGLLEAGTEAIDAQNRLEEGRHQRRLADLDRLMLEEGQRGEQR